MAFEKKNFEPEIIDEESDDFFGSRDGISIGKIVQMHILRLSSKVLDGTVDSGDSEKSGFVDNRREIFVDGVVFLRSLVKPYFDKEMKADELKIKEKIKKVEDRFYEASLEKEAYKRAKASKVPEQAYAYWKEQLKKTDYGYFDKRSPEYDYFVYQKFNIYMEMLTAISELMNRTNYLQEDDSLEII